MKRVSSTGSQYFSTLLILLATIVLLVHSDPQHVNNNSQPFYMSHQSSFIGRLLYNANLMYLLVPDDLHYVMNTYEVLGHSISIYDSDKSWTSQVVVKEINNGEYYLKDMLRTNRIPPGSVVLDLGTNIGITAIMVAKMFPGVHVIGVEAVPYNYAAALKNIEINGVADRVTILCGALSSDSSKMLRMEYSLGNPGSSTASHEFYQRGADDKQGKRVIDVKAITVEEIIEHFKIVQGGFKVPFIKLDCEGCEYDIVPNLSPVALTIFKDALIFGETHCNRMTVEPDIVRFVHDIYDAYEKSGPRGCDGPPKWWNADTNESSKYYKSSK